MASNAAVENAEGSPRGSRKKSSRDVIDLDVAASGAGARAGAGSGGGGTLRLSWMPRQTAVEMKVKVAARRRSGLVMEVVGAVMGIDRLRGGELVGFCGV